LSRNLNILIYEDTTWRNFAPLTDTRPVWDLRCGAFSLAECLAHQFPSASITYSTREAVAGVSAAAIAGAVVNRPVKELPQLFINGCAILTPDCVRQLQSGSESAIYTSGDSLVALRWTEPTPCSFDPANPESWNSANQQGLPVKSLKARLVAYPWELVKLAGTQLTADLTLASAPTSDAHATFPGDIITRAPDSVQRGKDVQFGPGVVLDAECNPIWLEDGVAIGPGAVLSGSDGPVWLAQNVTVEPGAILQGPLYVGEHSIIRAGARVSGGCSFGPHTRVGGEINNCIIQGYTNKQHSGYLGSSYLGSWVNLGAATDVSDLKNNYQPISVSINGETINTGELHLGVFIGDFTRTAIHTRLNSGSVIGVGCNILTSDFPPKELPSFIWLGSDGAQEYRLEKALETIRTIMLRRGKSLMLDWETFLRGIYDHSAGRRQKFLQSK